jgi:hypothetical protein
MGRFLVAYLTLDENAYAQELVKLFARAPQGINTLLLAMCKELRCHYS